ncbi:hypothetical protein EDM80_08950 [bacterium]|nr:MAG: hypothetical protein EDM80_08950 [bacterium]RIK61520.1 MAG: hypothetical protein DCC64_13040 [Planctomycetota bacterium]
MDLSAIPYLLISRNVELAYGDERVFVCLCLIDHLCVGVGTTRDDALRAMTAELERKYGECWEPEDESSSDDDTGAFDIDELSLN